MNVKVSEIQIVLVKPNKGLVAFCSFVLNDVLHCSSIAIFTKIDGGYRLVYPTKKLGNTNINIFYPIKNEFGKTVEEKVIEKYEEVMKQSDRYNCTDTR
ncbi:MAG: septation protein SpoVG family protein [Candidatus Auribacterota bacterium]